MANIYIKTFGCSLNQADSEAFAGQLVKEGHKIGGLKGAEVVIVNTCTVKGPTETNFNKFLRKIKTENKKAKVILAGCLPQAENKEEIIAKFPDYSIIGVFQLDKIAHVVEETLNGNKVYLLKSKKSKNRLELPIVRKNSIIEIIPINSGCLGNCTYCKTRFARGKLHSYPLDAIVRRVREATSSGVKEIWLTSQDLGAYGKDINSSLPKLLKEIIKIRKDFKVRLGMMNPNFAKEYASELIKILKSDKIFKFLHIPVQSGNNRILKKMNRKYSVEDFLGTIKKLKKSHPKLTIATDVIVGFPTETEEEFNDTLELLKETKPTVLNLSRYWARPGTKAASMKQISGEVSKKRSKKVLEVFDKYALNEHKRWLNFPDPRRALIDEEGKGNTFMCRNKEYKPIIIPKKKGLSIGDKVKVKIVKATKHDLRARVV